MRNTQLDDVTKIIRYLHSLKDHEGRKMQEIVYGARLPYVTVHKLVTKKFPWCFEARYRQLSGSTSLWYWTGEKPFADEPFDPNLPGEKEKPATKIDMLKSKWVWNQDAIRFLDKLFPGQTFAEVLTEANRSGNLRQFEILGKTMARAATEMKETGKIPYLKEDTHGS